MEPEGLSNDGAKGDEKRTKFGTRYLTDPQNVFQHNAWDNVVWDEEQENEARSKTESHTKHLVADDKREQYEAEADKFWDEFYGQHQNRFFKDRHWLFTEFPELYGGRKEAGGAACNAISSSNVESGSSPSGDDSHVTLQKESAQSNTAADAGNSHQLPPLSSLSLSTDDDDDVQRNQPFSMLEVGCGVGNTVFPVLTTNNNPHLKIFCCDFSSTAIQIVKEHPDYDTKRCHAFVHDITDESAAIPIPPNSLDVIIMIFVLSAVNPDKMQSAVNRLASYLKPGGVMLFRDYGRYDMAQLRFKPGRCISENFYVRGDGTRVYFFTQCELKSLFEKAGLEERENMIDRRLQVNRGRQLKMYRVWIQCKYVKPLNAVISNCDSSSDNS